MQCWTSLQELVNLAITSGRNLASVYSYSQKNVCSDRCVNMTNLSLQTVNILKELTFSKPGRVGNCHLVWSMHSCIPSLAKRVNIESSAAMTITLFKLSSNFFFEPTNNCLLFFLVNFQNLLAATSSLKASIVHETRY